MTPLLADESLNGDVIHGLRDKLPTADILAAAQCHLLGTDDRTVLEWAAVHGRLVVASDKRTMIGFAYDRVRSGLHMPGLIVVPQDVAVGVAVTDLETISQCLLPGEWENQVIYLPLRL